MYFLLKVGIFHCYVCLPEGTPPKTNMEGLSGKRSHSWLEYPHFQWEIHLPSGSIFHCYVSLPECTQNNGLETGIPALNMAINWVSMLNF